MVYYLIYFKTFQLFQNSLTEKTIWLLTVYLHLSYIPKYGLLCFINSLSRSCSFWEQFAFEDPSFHKIYPSMLRSHRRFTSVIHLSSFLEDSENTNPCHLYGVKNCYDTQQIVPPRLCMHFDDILNSQVMYTVKLNY